MYFQGSDEVDFRALACVLAMVAKVQNDFKEMRLKNAAAANDIKKNMAAPTTNSVKP